MLYYLAYNTFLMLAVVILSPVWLVWLALVPKVRAGFWEKLGVFPKEFLSRLENLPLENRIWIHAVSVGELNAARPLIKALTDRQYPVILSTTTKTGNQLAHKSFPELPVLFFPFDFPWVIEKTLRLLKPSVITILETEIWPNLMMHASRRHIPVLLANGRLSEKSYNGYVRLKPFFQWVLNHYTGIMMQAEADAQRIIQLGADASKVMVFGNIKFDLPPIQPGSSQAEMKTLYNFPVDSSVIVFASSHKGEEELFIRMFDKLALDFPNLRAILAPRHPERAKGVATMLSGHGAHFVQRSQLTAERPNDSDTPIILLDTIGELSAAYAISTLACMGGTFIEWGGHNPLEPINARIPVIFGPSMHNFKDIASRVIEANAGFKVDTPEQAIQRMRELLTRPEYYAHIVENGQKLLSDNRGITEKLVNIIESHLNMSRVTVNH